ncbi:MAG: hypothetical protein ABJG88_03765 [Litorimonas sp.]
MRSLHGFMKLSGLLCLAGCVSSPVVKQNDFESYRLTAVEAKTHACPQSVLEVGATPKDCRCAQDTLFDLGQDGALLSRLEGGTTEITDTKALSGIKPRRVTAIEILRLDAFESCGFFEPGHPVGEGL